MIGKQLQAPLIFLYKSTNFHGKMIFIVAAIHATVRNFGNFLAAKILREINLAKEKAEKLQFCTPLKKISQKNLMTRKIWMAKKFL